DVKTLGIPLARLADGLTAAKTARTQILNTMNATIAQARTELSPHAPRVEVIQIPPDKIGGVIGTGGKTIRRLIAESGCSKIEILDDKGRILVVGKNAETLQKGAAMIKAMTETAEVGKVYMGRVSKIMDFGAFVEILPGTDGLVHVSQLAHERVNHPSDILKEGDEVKVKVLEVDPGTGKIRLSRKECLEPGSNGGGGDPLDMPSEPRREREPERQREPRREPQPERPREPEPAPLGVQPLDEAELEKELEEDGPQPGPGAHERTGFARPAAAVAG